MLEINGTTIFWLLTLGMVVGGVMKLVLGSERGLGITTNVVGGMLGALTVGVLALWVNVPGSLLLALMATMAILFLGNIFYMEEEENPKRLEEESI